jgi:hypothetical protein
MSAEQVRRVVREVRFMSALQVAPVDEMTDEDCDRIAVESGLLRLVEGADSKAWSAMVAIVEAVYWLVPGKKRDPAKAAESLRSAISDCEEV